MAQQDAVEELDPPSLGPDLIVITGMSGAGRTEAMHTFEDLGYFCIDNLPPSLLLNLVSLAGLNVGSSRKLAVVCDLRAQEFFPELTRELGKLDEMGITTKVLFLDSTDEQLLNRYKATRRRHPLCEGDMSVLDGIRKERDLLDEARKQADYVLDTSVTRPQDTRAKIRALFASENDIDEMRISVYSFGFKHGAPIDADIVIDVRFLPNPYYDKELVDQVAKESGFSHEFIEEIGEQMYRLDQPETKRFLERWYALLDEIIPGYIKEGKQYLTIGVGCTGGQHRSVALATVTGQHLSQAGYHVNTTHRDLALAEVN